MDINHILRNRAAVEADARTWLANRDPNAPKQSRNRNTGERGISYVRSTNRYRTFAHKPVYMYVGTFKELSVAVKARNAAEAINMQRLAEAVPEAHLRSHKANPRRISVKLHRRNHKCIDATFRADGWELTHPRGFPDFDSALYWLQEMRQRLPAEAPKRKGGPKAA